MSSASWVSCMPEDDVEHLTERSDERRQLFEDISNRLPASQLSPLVWAFFQVGNLDQLRQLASTRISWMIVYVETESSYLERGAEDTIRLWMQSSAATTSGPASRISSASIPSQTRPPSPLSLQRSRTRSRRSLGGMEYSPVRDRRVTDLCKERDHGRCVVSKVGGIDACHIYPWCAFGMRDTERVSKFWEVLAIFWPEEKVASWKAKIFRDSRTPYGTETVENMLTLTATLHRFHSQGAFALRPVRMSEDKTRLELEFHWLARQQRELRTRVDLRVKPISSRDWWDPSGLFAMSGHEDPRRPTFLSSGARFVMTTDDPTSKPLPDPGLLELQWHLQRILAMSGASGWKEEDFDNDPSATAGVLSSVEQWLDNLQSDEDRSRCSSPVESVEVTNGAFQ